MSLALSPGSGKHGDEATVNLHDICNHAFGQNAALTSTRYSYTMNLIGVKSEVHLYTSTDKSNLQKVIETQQLR